jgi:hypothetical protein
MKARSGEIMGYLAYGHPFLDGNGRTIMTAHSALAQRAGFSIDWTATKISLQRRQRGRRQYVAAREHHHHQRRAPNAPGAPARPGWASITGRGLAGAGRAPLKSLRIGE